jgi:hypothetical protein
MPKMFSGLGKARRVKEFLLEWTTPICWPSSRGGTFNTRVQPRWWECSQKAWTSFGKYQFVVWKEPKNAMKNKSMSEDAK